jgi:hypothetical protein
MRVIKFVVFDGSMCVKFHRKFVQVIAQQYLENRVCVSERVTCYDLGYVILDLTTILKNTSYVV